MSRTGAQTSAGAPYLPGVTVAPDEWFPERFALKFRKTDSQYLRVGDLSLGELWELHHELGHLLAVMDAVPKGDSDG